MVDEIIHNDSFVDDDEPRSSTLVWDALCDARREQEQYWTQCDRIDQIIDAGSTFNLSIPDSGLSDQEFDLFWASLEIIKTAVYARPPKPVVTPRFNDRNRVAATASEMIERCLETSFDNGDFDRVMFSVRDDLITAGRGVVRVTYESDEEGTRICEEHMDRRDFLHEPARKWSEVGWVAFAAYMTEREFRKRFPKASSEGANFTVRRDRDIRQEEDSFARAKIWEVWHKADNRVYWVTEGVQTFLDESEPFLELSRFFPCPEPAYGTLKRRSLTPVPDYTRYQSTLDQINEVTRRIHGLLEWIRVRGLIPAGGDVGQALELALSQNNDDVMLIPIPAGGLISGNGNFVQFLPLVEFAQTVTGLIEARRELINNYYELSGISDIMRGATEAGETLGAQRLKSQFGSVRIREKVSELQRVARDVSRISAEIIAGKFSKETLQEMAMMNLPTDAELKKKLKELEASAKADMDDLEKSAREAADQAMQSGQQIDPEQAQAQFSAAQKEIVDKYQPMIAEVTSAVTIDQVMALLKDKKNRAFAIDIETDSTIMTDEVAEKAGRAEFLQAFTGASSAVQPLLMAGDSGSKLAGGLLKFALAPFRVGRTLDGLIDDFIANAPAALASQQEAGGENAELAQTMAQAQMKLADAEVQKAQAAIAKVQADTAKSQQDLQLKAAQAQASSQEAEKKFALELEQTRSNIAETNARIEKVMAEIQKLGVDAQATARQADREDVKTVAGLEKQKYDQTMGVADRQRQAADSERSANMSERQQAFNERTRGNGMDNGEGELPPR